MQDKVEDKHSVSVNPAPLLVRLFLEPWAGLGTGTWRGVQNKARKTMSKIIQLYSPAKQWLRRAGDITHTEGGEIFNDPKKRTS